MKHGTLLLGIITVTLLATVGTVMAGFNQYGYNDKARVFIGTGYDWCYARGWTQTQCDAFLGPYVNDNLVMKWNAEWDRGNDEGWNDPNGYAAWENNEWNGMCDECSGEVWHYMIKWVGNCVTYPELLPEGSYCIWGQFAVTMDQGTSDGEHIWLAHGIPTGYGA